MVKLKVSFQSVKMNHQIQTTPFLRLLSNYLYLFVLLFFSYHLVEEFGHEVDSHRSDAQCEKSVITLTIKNTECHKLTKFRQKKAPESCVNDSIPCSLAHYGHFCGFEVVVFSIIFFDFLSRVKVLTFYSHCVISNTNTNDRLHGMKRKITG